MPHTKLQGHECDVRHGEQVRCIELEPRSWIRSDEIADRSGAEVTSAPILLSGTCNKYELLFQPIAMHGDIGLLEDGQG